MTHPCVFQIHRVDLETAEKRENSSAQSPSLFPATNTRARLSQNLDWKGSKKLAGLTAPA